MINRFSTVGQSEYTPQHVPLPFEAIGALGEKIQKTQDAAIDDTYKLKDLMTKVPAIYDPNLGLSNIQKKKELDAQFAPKIDELTNKIMAGDVNATRELEQVKRDFANNPIRQELEESYLNYKTYKDDITKKGGKYDRLLDDYYGQKLIDDSGELKPFRYSGMEESLDAPKRFKEVMGDIAEDAKSWDIESLGKDGIKIGSKGKRAGVNEAKVNKVVNNKVNLALNTDEGKQFVKRLRRMKPDITNEELINETRKALFSSAYEQIGTDIESGNTIGLTDMWTRQQDKKEEFDGPMPTYQNPVTGVNEKITHKSGLNWLGINTDNIDESGKNTLNLISNKGNYEVTLKDGKKIQVSSIENAKDMTRMGGTYQYKEIKASDNQRLRGTFYSQLLTKAREFNLDLPKVMGDPKKVDFEKLQENLSKYGQNMQLQGTTSAGLQSRFGNNLSNELLGTVTAKEDGTIVFKKSPLLGGAKIVDQSTGEVISKNKEEVAKDGAIRGINYFAPEAGTYRMDSKNKAYNYNPGDNTLNKMTQNTHSLTQDIIKARQGKQNSKTIIDSDNNTVGDYANNIVNSLKENFKTIPANNPQGMMLANHLNENLTKLNGYEPVSVRTSDILIQEGPRKGSPKYNYVAYEHKGFGTTNKADDKVLRVDAESGQTEIMTLGDIHASERDYLQQNYAGAFEPTK